MLPWEFSALDAAKKAAMIGFIKVRIEAERRQNAKARARKR
jgi:hypothetical protein